MGTHGEQGYTQQHGAASVWALLCSALRGVAERHIWGFHEKYRSRGNVEYVELAVVALMEHNGERGLISWCRNPRGTQGMIDLILARWRAGLGTAGRGTYQWSLHILGEP